MRRIWAAGRELLKQWHDIFPASVYCVFVCMSLCWVEGLSTGGWVTSASCSLGDILLNILPRSATAFSTSGTQITPDKWRLEAVYMRRETFYDMITLLCLSETFQKLKGKLFSLLTKCQENDINTKHILPNKHYHLFMHSYGCICKTSLHKKRKLPFWVKTWVQSFLGGWTCQHI